MKPWRRERYLESSTKSERARARSLFSQYTNKQKDLAVWQGLFGAGDVTRTRDLLITNHYKKTRLGRRFAPNSPLPKVLFVGMLARISHLFID